MIQRTLSHVSADNDAIAYISGVEKRDEFA